MACGAARRAPRGPGRRPGGRHPGRVRARARRQPPARRPRPARRGRRVSAPGRRVLDVARAGRRADRQGSQHGRELDPAVEAAAARCASSSRTNASAWATRARCSGSTSPPRSSAPRASSSRRASRSARPRSSSRSGARPSKAKPRKAAVRRLRRCATSRSGSTRTLGGPVTITEDEPGKAGRIEIRYLSLDHLERLLDRLL